MQSTNRLLTSSADLTETHSRVDTAGLASPGLDPPASDPLAPRPAPSSPPPSTSHRVDTESPRSLYPHLWRAMTILAVALFLRFTLPPTLEEIQYGLTRGRQRAEFETAGQVLDQLNLQALSSAYQLVSQRVAPSVVHVETRTPLTDQDIATLNSNPSRGPKGHGPSFGDSINGERREQGSGVVVDSSGLIVTNHHVVASADRITVTLSDGRRVAAEVVGHDPLTDLAVLRVDADKLIAAKWGDSDRLHEGALVWAVGTPYGLKRSITAGIVSAKSLAGVAGSVYQDYLQTDAAINPGSSGGPLVDVQGNVVGINTAILGKAYQGISFAVPSNIVQEVYMRIIEEGRVDRGWLGVQLAAVTAASPHQADPTAIPGALVQSVTIRGEDMPSPAAIAGIQQGDLIVRWEENPVAGNESLMRHVARSQVGSCVQMEILRNGQPMMISVTVGKRPADLPSF